MIKRKKTKKKDLEIAEKFNQQAKALKKKYESLDESSKKKLITGVAGAVAILAGIGAVKKIQKKQRRK